MRKPVLAGIALLAVGPVLAGTLPNAGATATPVVSALRPLVGPDGGGFPGAEVALGDVDARGPRLAPLAGARAALARLGGDVDASWTQYGTVLSATRAAGYLSRHVPGATPEAIARTWLARNAALVGLTAKDVQGLELLSALPLPESDVAHVVQLRQRSHGILLAEDGLISIGVRGHDVVILTSSAVPAETLARISATRPALDALQAVVAAAKDAGVRNLGPDDVRLLGKNDGAGFTLVSATGLAQRQRARLRALGTTDGGGTRLVWETDILDVAGAKALATITFVDAVTGKVLLRRDAVDTLAEGTRGSAATRSVGTAPALAPSGGPFVGTYTATACSAKIPLDVQAGVQQIVIAAHAANPNNDITIQVTRGKKGIGTIDTLSTPEAGTIAVKPAAKAGETFSAQVCPFDASGTAPFDFAGSYVTSEQSASTPALPSGIVGPASTTGPLFPATWKAFSANPQFPFKQVAAPDDRDKICGTTHADKSAKAKGCSRNGFTYFDASPFAYDVDAVTGLPTFTTIGNNAVTSNAQASSSLTPGGPFLPPASPTRDYAPSFTDSWHANKCDPAALVSPLGNRGDVDAAIVNLFVGHNRVHDFSYRLGLTEQRGALQVTNFGKGGAEEDPELGNAQNAGLTGGSPAYLGRDNANQITLQDGVPGITNQYLFQPVLGFYSPCTDGDLDGSVFLHEYTHATSNRLVAGPDVGLSGSQASSMGEAWSDLVAIEYLNAFGLAGKRGEDPFALGAYVTGDPYRGIRDFNLRDNPLNFADFGFDATGPEFHADGEIWNGVQVAVRNDLVKKWNAKYSSKDRALQAACALGRTTAGKKHSTFEGCPGNRRWVTYLFDAMILQANGSPSMVDMKNAQLAADMLRTGGVDQRVMANGFARRGLGAGSSSSSSNDTDPTPSFATPAAFGKDNGTVTFSLVDATTGKPVKGDVYVGEFQARATPVASTVPGSETRPTAKMISGAYKLIVQARGYGLQRFGLTVAAGRSTTKKIALLPNLASVNRGATVQAAGWTRLRDVLDDDEATDGGFDGIKVKEGPVGGQSADDSKTRTPIAGKSFTVALAGGKQRVGSIAVSALHRPVRATNADQAPDFQGRLLGLHEFEVQASSDGGRTYRTVYRSPQSFFPTGSPRAVAPDLNLRTVQLPGSVVADHLRLVVKSNTCTGTPDFRGDRDNDPNNNSDCPSTDNAYRVTITEFQAFGR
ncbi:MAG: M36 family metallopeptidase [Actinobacteria bacterium]|nr:M36 family metallopeptidase [Actinomycetota bacterium]MCA1721153.1 M36 family metallopeptidase [Actinomycetota bacterium]